jgi:DNA-binding transcriptional LysR family regulator
MPMQPGFDTIDLHLIRVLHTVIHERSVSRAAVRLASSQPAVSAQLRRLRRLTGDPLLVRAGQQMHPTETALQLLGPAERLLQEAEQLFGRHRAQQRRAAFDPARAEGLFRVAASDYLDPLFLPRVVARLKREAPATWRLATSTSSSATGSSRRRSCTWRGWSATRSSAWWPSATPTPAAAAGRASATSSRSTWRRCP